MGKGDASILHRSGTAGANRRRESGLWQRIVAHKTLYLLFLPVLIYYVLVRYWPIGMAWIVAFKDLKLGAGVWGSEWIGLDNFRILFTDPQLVKVLRNTVEISLLRIVFGFVPPIILAVMFHDLTSRRFKKWTQTIVYIPHFFSWVIMFGIVFALFSTGTGLVNNAMEAMGFPRKEFFLDQNWFRPLLIGSAIWKEIGWGTIIYLAALATVDPQLYEAAAMDGAGPLRRIYHITLPGLSSVIIFLICLQLGTILYAGGEQILLFYNQAVLDKADVVDTWIYRESLGRMQYSIGTAMGLFQSFVGMLLVLATNALSKRFAGRGIW